MNSYLYSLSCYFIFIVPLLIFLVDFTDSDIVVKQNEEDLSTEKRAKPHLDEQENEAYKQRLKAKGKNQCTI